MSRFGCENNSEKSWTESAPLPPSKVRLKLSLECDSGSKYCMTILRSSKGSRKKMLFIFSKGGGVKGLNIKKKENVFSSMHKYTTFH